MLKLPGYRCEEELAEGRAAQLYRGHRISDGQPVVLKRLMPDFPTSQAMEAFRREYVLTRQAEATGCVIKALELLEVESSLVMVLEDIGGHDLSAILSGQPMEIGAALRLSVALAEALCHLHRLRISHNDLNPRNIIYNQDTGEVRLTDLGIACDLGQMTEPATDRLEGSLAYIAPEQTGRMRQSPDHRADFYALGVTLYEMLAGRKPFLATDPLELVHCHLAVTPPPLEALAPLVPPVLATIVAKLMAKAAAERYQSTYGLLCDVRRCLTEWERQGRIDAFPIATQDVPARLELPSVLFGRDEPLQRLTEAFRRVRRGGVELVLIGGASGVGKSALVTAFRDHSDIHGLFGNGKFDPLQRDTPYMAVRQAVRRLVEHCLAHEPQRIEAVRSELGVSLGLIADLVPELHVWLGPLPPVMELPAGEAQNRFDYVFQRFIQAFCSPATPLILFLDDLQWADAASLRLIGLLLHDPTQHHMLLIGTYRDNEVGPEHPLHGWGELASRHGGGFILVDVQPLRLQEVKQLIETVFPKTVETQALAAVCHRKTLGNPFFLRQLLSALYQERLIEFDGTTGQWVWDLHRIETWDVSDNVVAFMVRILNQLPPTSVHLLQWAACLGNSFMPERLALLADMPLADVHQQLAHPLREGLLLAPRQERAEPACYLFVHDQVRKAAYFHLPDPERQAMHLRIGRYLQQTADDPTASDELFDIVNHLNAAQSLLEDGERCVLATLNLAAARRALAANAYTTALELSRQGLALVGETGWDCDHALTFALYRTQVLCVQLGGDIEQALTLCDMLLSYTQTALTRADIHGLRTELYATHGRFAEALTAAVEGLRLLDEPWPEREEELQQATAADSALIEAYLAKHEVEQLLELPVMTDERAQHVVRLLGLLWGPAINVNLSMSTLAVVRIVTLSIRYGNGDLSPFGYANYGSMLSAFFSNYRLGYRFGKLAVALVEQTGNLSMTCKVHTMFAVTNSPWSSPLEENVRLLRTALQAGLQIGDAIWTSYSAFHILKHLQHSGAPLEYLVTECERVRPILTRIGDPNTLEVFTLLCQAIRLFQGKTDHAGTWNTADFDEAALLASMQRNQHALCLNYYHYNKMQGAYLFGRLDEALLHACEAEATLASTFGWFSIAEHNFYQSLILLALLPEAAQDVQASYQQKIRENQARMAVWAEHCPANFEHKQLLVKAEQARLEGDTVQAMSLYDQAIDSARQHGFRQGTALAEELCARFWLAQDKPRIAQAYLQDAHRDYGHWGATAKVQALEHEFARWLYPQRDDTQATQQWPVTASNAGEVARLDWMSILKSLQTISTELALDQLLGKVMRILLEDAGAQQGMLLLPHEGQWCIQAVCRSDEPAPVVRQAMPVAIGTGDALPILVPPTVIAQVIRTRLPMILDDAAAQGGFVNDPYIRTHRPRSVICLPVMRQEQLIGVLYLENNLLPYAFTPARLQALNILAAQAAISLEHAMLYETLEQRVAERTAELDQARIRAEQAATAKSLFLATMSHEIRTPLNAVIGLSRLTLKTALSSEQQGYVDKILGSGEVLLGVINDILDFSRNESGGMVLEHIRFNLAKVIERAFTICALKAHEKQLELILDLAPEVPQVLQGDPLRLQQVLINLVSNAIKFTDHGHVRLRITAEPAGRGWAYVRFEVEDTGIGIDLEQQQVLFQPFTQVDGSITRRYGGTGLGLAICKQLIELMKGHIGVQSEPGQGSCFTFDLTLPVIESVDEGHGARVATGLRVLVVDDHPHVREVLVRQLTALGIEAVAVDNGAEAVSRLQTGEVFDLVLMDWHMPTCDGLAAVRQFKTSVPTVLLVSPYELEEAKSEAMDVELVGFLEKPVTPAGLQRVLDGLQQEQLPSPSLSLSQEPSWLDLHGIKILLVDDNAINRQVVIGFLQDTGIVIETAEDGQEALEKLENQAYDLVLMDIHMPRLDGLATTRLIRQRPALRRIPIIAMTANALPEDREKSLAAGMSDHLVKPINPTDLYRLLVSWGNPGIRPAMPPHTKDTAPAAWSPTFLATLETSPRLDVARALARLQGRRALYQHLVLDFIHDHSGTVEAMHTLQATGDTASLQLKVHSLRSAAAYIGAYEVSEACAALEHALIQGDDVPVTSVQPIISALEPLMAELSGLRQPQEEHAVMPLPDRHILVFMLERLLTLLEASDFEAEVLLPNLLRMCKGSTVEPMIRQLERWVDEVEFERAAIAVADLIQRLRAEVVQA
ncbi:putative ATPase [Pseudomonas duriflava]|uniref:histidine kinase n=1 Tax=Pseudomonas duriflava TaxID=459528 RepID=A0A562Q6W1_9PSED|nr:response regulator [Pseudomonas duriflava]TWI52505.1 putative ATPase [Pseudomonas duriflava]